MNSLFHGMVSTFRTLGIAAVAQNLFTLENAVDTGRVVRLLDLTVEIDATAVLTAVMPQFKVSRPTALPTGGTTLSKAAFDPAKTSGTGVVARGATASDGGTATAITATPGAVVRQAFGMRVHTAVGQIISLKYPLLPSQIKHVPFFLRPGQSLLVSLDAAAATSNPITNHYIVQAVWEELLIKTVRR